MARPLPVKFPPLDPELTQLIDALPDTSHTGDASTHVFLAGLVEAIELGVRTHSPAPAGEYLSSNAEHAPVFEPALS